MIIVVTVLKPFPEGALGTPKKAAVGWRAGKDDIETKISNPEYLLCQKFKAKTVLMNASGKTRFLAFKI